MAAMKSPIVSVLIVFISVFIFIVFLILCFAI